MACPVPSHLPSAIDAGTTVAFTVSDCCHPSSLWTAVMVFNNGVAAPVSVTLTANADGTRFDAAISATVSATLALGPTTAIPIFTKISDTSVKEYGRAQATTVFPAITATAVPTAAQAMLTALEIAIKKLSGAVNQSVSFNGQSYSKGDLTKLLQERVRLQAEIIAEQKAALAARGGRVYNGHIQTEFVPTYCGPYPYFQIPGVYPCCP